MMSGEVYFKFMFRARGLKFILFKVNKTWLGLSKAVFFYQVHVTGKGLKSVLRIRIRWIRKILAS